MSTLKKANQEVAYEKYPKTQQILAHMKELFEKLQMEERKEKPKEIDEKQFILLLGGISVCRKIPGIHSHMGYESLYVCREEEDAGQVKAHLERMYGIQNKEELLQVCGRMYSSDEDYMQFESFWQGKPVFDINRLNPQGKESFEACKEYAALFEPFVKEKGFFAWDCNERIGLLRAAYACGLVEEEEFWFLTVPLAKEAAERYGSWMEYAISCLCGAVYFMFCQSAMTEDGSSQFYEINQELIAHLLSENGAWNRNQWFSYPKKKFLKSKEEMKELLKNWEEPEGCIATDRITVDGCKVGYMYRELPANESDSGWRFMAGDESEEYMANPANSGIYRLNTICNYDEDIISFLHSPFQNAYFRDENGEFKWEEWQDEK